MRCPPFLSVSALSQLETQPNKFYLQRLSDTPIEREPQNFAAAVGTAFDIALKQHLLENNLLTQSGEKKLLHRFVSVPWPQEHKQDWTIEKHFLESLEPQNRTEEVFAMGKRVLDAYLKTPLYSDNIFQDADIRVKMNLSLTLNGERKSVPIYGIVDAQLPSGPMDLKVSGAVSGVSPRQKYYCSFDEQGRALGMHKKYIGESCPFEDIDPFWATQGCTYGWLLGQKLFEPFVFKIHAGFFGKPKSNGYQSLKICGYKGIISKQFQQLVALRYLNAWDLITNSSQGNIPWSSEQLLAEMLSRQERWYM